MNPCLPFAAEQGFIHFAHLVAVSARHSVDSRAGMDVEESGDCVGQMVAPPKFIAHRSKLLDKVEYGADVVLRVVQIEQQQLQGAISGPSPDAVQGRIDKVYALVDCSNGVGEGLLLVVVEMNPDLDSFPEVVHVFMNKIADVIGVQGAERVDQSNVMNA